MTRARDNSFNPFNNQAAGKNYIINGAFDYWQRGTSFTNISAHNTYLADRWSSGTAGWYNIYASRQLTNDSVNLPNIQYYMRFGRTSGNTNGNWNFITQSLETANSIPLIGKTITLSFYARAGANFSSAGNGLISYILAGTGTDQNANLGYTNQTYSYGGHILTSNWQRFTNTYTVPLNATELAVSIQYAPTGTAGVNDYFDITGVQLELGPTATQFSRAGGTIGGELALCQRYYQKSYDTDGVPGNNSGSGKINFNTPNRTDQYAIEFNTNFKVTMRGTPSVSIFSPVTGTSGRVRDEAAGTDRAAIAKNIGQNTAQIEGDSGVTTTANGLHSVQWVASAEL